MLFSRISGAIARRSYHRVACALALGVFATAAAATDFTVTGSISINGNTGALPDGTFLGSSYDPITGAIGAGTFKFPVTTVSQGANSLTYQLSQTNSSTGLVDGSGVAALSNAAFSVRLINGTYNGFPVTFGASCIFAPINMALTGTATATGLDLAESGFTIPQTTDNCNNFAALMNPAVSGSSNAIQLHIDGDFAPPDTIFADGFESPR